MKPRACGRSCGRFISSALLLSFGENMITAECDEKGRIQLGPELRQRYGRRFFVVEAPGELVLLPVAEEPVKDLQKLGRKLNGYTIGELKERIHQQAMDEVGA